MDKEIIAMFLAGSLTLQGNTDAERRAITTSQQILYSELKLDQPMNKLIEHYIPHSTRTVGGLVIGAYGIYTQRWVSFTYNFP